MVQEFINNIVALVLGAYAWLTRIPGIYDFIFRFKVLSLFVSVGLFAAWVYVDLIKKSYLSGVLYRKLVYMREPLKYAPDKYSQSLSKIKFLISAKRLPEAFKRIEDLLWDIVIYYGELYGTLSERVGRISQKVMPQVNDLKKLATLIEDAKSKHVKLTPQEIAETVRLLEDALRSLGVSSEKS